MNIWLFNHYAVTPDQPGSSRHFDFARELKKRGHEVTIFASSFHYTLHKETREYKNTHHLIEEHDGVRFVCIKTPPYKKNNWRRLANMMSFASTIKKIAKTIELTKPDIIVGSSVHLFTVKSAEHLAKHFDVPFVMEVRDLWPETLIDMGMSKLHPAILVFSILEKYLYKKADKIITLLPRAHRYIEKKGISSEKITWISNGVDMNRFNDQNPENEDCVVRYAGALGPANNLELLIKAAQLLQDTNIRIEIIGSGQEKEKLTQFVTTYGITNVHFVDAVPKKEVVGLLQTADILYMSLLDLPVFKYGVSSNKIFDYLAAGRPIIYACNTGNNLIKEAQAGITVDPNDPRKLANALRKLARTPESEKRQMGQRGREFVKIHYGIPALVDKLEKVFKEAAI